MTTNVQKVSVAIIGGGLSGLYAAFLLEKKGVDYVLLEARKTLGGRVLAGESTKNPSLNDDVSTTHSFDLGPSWFWPDYQPQLADVIDELQLESFVQWEAGDTIVERTANEPIVRVQGYKSSPPSMRIKGGTIALIKALHSRLNPTRVVTGEVVHKLSKSEHGIKIQSENTLGQTNTFYADQVLLALPPRLVEESIIFKPDLPVEVTEQWRNTATWMAPHAKYIAVYDVPFWREQGLSGAARSSLGPMVEIHDASITDGQGALFGFIGVPATSRANLTDDVMKKYCRDQFVRLFGTQAANPNVEYIKDWSKDAFTSTAIDVHSNGQHSVAPVAQPMSGTWSKCLIGIGSEWSPQFSGYLAGAIEAASLGVEGLAKLELN